jgi:hypothetical protein
MVCSGLSLVNLDKENRGTGWGPVKIKTQKSQICDIRDSLSPRKLEHVRYISFEATSENWLGQNLTGCTGPGRRFPH